ncbi:MAG: acyltransferase [Acidobacteriota bacterium]|nr:acyltransferase [Acidobacteriota bacterium]
MSDGAAVGTRKRLEHIDAMRPIKQAAVISTHALIFFAPIGANVLATGLIMLTRFSRDAFLFVSACMLAYSYRDAARINLATYSKKRLLSVGLPYVTWTLIYFVYTLLAPRSSFPYYSWHPGSVTSFAGLRYFWHLLSTGYYHLYYLLVILEFYAVFPWMLRALRRVPRWHVTIMVAAVAWQIFYGALVSAHFFGVVIPGVVQTRLLISYPIYLVGGVIVALHLDAVHDWIVTHARLIVVLTLGGVALAEGLWVASSHVALPAYLQTGPDVFSPAVLPYNVGAILCVYLLGVYLVSTERGLTTRAVVQSGSDNSYGVYLSQMIWIPLLVRARTHLGIDVPWEVAAPVALVIVYALGFFFTALMARTPLARAITGRGRVSWSSLRPHRVRASSWHEDRGDGPLEMAAD